MQDNGYPDASCPASAADDSARYWAENYDRLHEVPSLNPPPPPAGAEPVRPRGKQQVMRDDLRSWASTWVRKLIADGGAYGPGSRRTISLTGDSWDYLTDDGAIEQTIEDLRQATFPRPPGRYAVTFERSMSGTRRLHIYAVEFRADMPPQRLHLAQPFADLMGGRCQATGEVSEFADDAARNQPRRPAAAAPREGAVPTRPRPRAAATPLWQAVVAGAFFFVALIVHSSYSDESSACTVSDSGSFAYVYDTPACTTAFRATDTSRWVMIVAGAATVGLAGRRYLGR